MAQFPDMLTYAYIFYSEHDYEPIPEERWEDCTATVMVRERCGQRKCADLQDGADPNGELVPQIAIVYPGYRLQKKLVSVTHEGNREWVLVVERKVRA